MLKICHKESEYLLLESTELYDNLFTMYSHCREKQGRKKKDEKYIFYVQSPFFRVYQWIEERQNKKCFILNKKKLNNINIFFCNFYYTQDKLDK